LTDGAAFRLLDDMTARSGRSIYAGILALALGGLVVDRWILASAADPQPGAPVVASEAANPDAASFPPPGDARSDSRALARRLEALRDLNVDAATLPESFARLAPEVSPTVADARPMPSPPAVSATLVGVRPAAIVAGRTVALGTQLEGWTVLDISRSAVVFGRDGAVVERSVR
jgi:hypothetical protein